MKKYLPLIFSTFLVLLLFQTPASDDGITQENILREAFDLPEEAVPQLNDQQFLNVVETAARLASLQQNESFEIYLYESLLNFKFVSKEKEVFVFCHFHGNKPHCTGPFEDEFLFEDFGPSLHKISLSLDKLYEINLAEEDQLNAIDVAAYGAAFIVSYYGAKKVFNKLLTGKWLNDGHAHSHFFLSKENMEKEISRYSNILSTLDFNFHNLVEDINKNNEQVRAQKAMDRIAEDIFQVGLQLLRKASSTCGHAGCSGHHHHHNQDQFKIVLKAKETILSPYKKFATTLSKDFYKELIAPIIQLAKSTRNPLHRQQLWNFVELTTIRSIQERGVTSAMTSGAFIFVGQAAVETLESLLMPGGVHLYCHVGNALVLAAASTMYAGEFCLRNIGRLKGLKTKDRLKIVSQSLRLPYLARGLEHRDIDKFNRLSIEDQTYLALKLTHMNVSKKLNYARTLNLIDKKTSRDLARSLGKMQNEMDLIGLELRAIKYHQDSLRSNAIISMITNWHKNITDLNAQLPQGTRLKPFFPQAKSDCSSIISVLLDQ